ncbi:MAG: GNAT family N-acetyltransferase [Micropepsaceae bacterium]
MRDSKPSLTVPTLMSERLTLEPLTRAHSDGMFVLWSDVEACRYSGPAHDMSGVPITLPARVPADSDRIIDFFLHGAAAGERFRWAVLTRAERQFIGAAGFNALGACSEYAYHLIPAFWGHGYMAEASLAALRWLRGEPHRECVEAFIAPDNVASIKLATRLGFRASGSAVDGADRYQMRLDVLET